jgi:hypothetical protein
MNDLMTLDRFRELADAYGGVVARWPEPDRAAAMRLASQPEAITILAQASALDALLDTWTVAAHSADLRRRVANGAPDRTRNLVWRARLRWSGIGIGAALAGALAGAAVVAMTTAIDMAPDTATPFGVVDTQDS